MVWGAEGYGERQAEMLAEYARVLAAEGYKTESARYAGAAALTVTEG